MPPIGKTNSYSIDSEQQCFFVNNNYIEPLNKIYNVNISNPFSLEIGDSFELHLKIPTQIIGNNSGYDLNNIADEIKNNNLVVGLDIKASNKQISIKLSDESFVEVNSYCGWIMIIIKYQASVELCNICDISYNICFDKIKIKQLYKKNKYSSENIDINSSMCMNLVKSNINSIINSTDDNQFIVTVTLNLNYKEFIENVNIEQLRDNLITDFANKFDIEPDTVQIIFTEGSVKINYYVKKNGSVFVNGDQVSETAFQQYIYDNTLDTTIYTPTVEIKSIEKKVSDVLAVEPLFPYQLNNLFNDYDSNSNGYNNSLININEDGLNIEISPSGELIPDNSSSKLKKITNYSFIHVEQQAAWSAGSSGVLPEPPISGVTFDGIKFRDLKQLIIKGISTDGNIDYTSGNGFELFVRIYVYASDDVTDTTNNFSWYGSSMLLKKIATQQEIESGEIVFDINPNTLPKLYADNGNTNGDSLTNEDYDTIKTREVSSVSFQTNSGYSGSEYRFSYKQQILYYQKEDDIERSLSNYYPNIYNSTE